MNSDQIKQLQQMLVQRGINVPVTGILDQTTLSAMNSAVAKSLASHPNFAQFSGGNSPEALATAGLTGDYSGVNTLTGQPFTPAEQADAVSKSTAALQPGFDESKSYDTSNVADSIQEKNTSLKDYLYNEGQNFKQDKIASDQDAADKGVLFSGARVQKERDLKKLYEDRDSQNIASTNRNIASTTKDYQYKYGNSAVPALSNLYNSTPAGNSYATNVAGGGVTPKAPVASTYNPAQYDFQGTAVNANKANVQTRAAGILQNRANKLTSTGYKTQY